MSMHRDDYLSLAGSLFSWFSQAVQLGLSTPDALKTVAVGVLGQALAQYTPPAPQVPLAPIPTSSK